MIYYYCNKLYNNFSKINLSMVLLSLEIKTFTIKKREKISNGLIFFPPLMLLNLMSILCFISNLYLFKKY